MPQAGVKCKLGNKRFAECLTCKTPCLPLPIRQRFSYDDKRHPPGGISVTKLNKCPRKVYHQLTQPFYTDVDGLVGMEVGKSIHFSLQYFFDVREREIHYTTPSGLELTGYVDGIDLKSTPTVLWEVKTHRYINKNCKAPEPELDHNTLQVQIYHTMLKHMGYQLDEIRLLHIGLANMEILERKVPVFDHTDYINERMDILHNAVETQTPPEPAPMWSWDCRLCDYAKSCPIGDLKHEKGY